MDVAQLVQKLKEHGQEHLLQFWPSLTEEERQQLFHQLNEYVIVSLHGIAFIN